MGFEEKNQKGSDPMRPSEASADVQGRVTVLSFDPRWRHPGSPAVDYIGLVPD